MESQVNNCIVQANQWNGKVVHDKCCWYCHKNGISLQCTTCFRSFHINCLKEVDKNSSQIKNRKPFDCSICVSLNASKVAFVGKKSILKLLKYTINAILVDEYFAKLERLQGDDIVNPIGLNDIKQKIDRITYGSLNEFLIDIECIQHNYAIRKAFVTYTCSKLVKFCESEVEHIISCSDCFEMKYTKPTEWRTLACSKPHLLLLIKLDHGIKTIDMPSNRINTFWPAKLLSVGINSIGTEVVNAIFFGRSQLVEIPPVNCFIYNRRPSKPTRTSKDIENSQKEVDLYIENIWLKFDRIEITLNNIPFKSHLLLKYIQDMFPGYSNRNDRIANGTNDDTNDSSESDTNDKSTDVLPKKRQRLSDGNISDLQEEFTVAIKYLNVLSKKSDEEINTTIQTMNQNWETLKKSYADCQTKNDKLVGKLNIASDKCDRAELNAKNEMTKIKESHAKEIKTLNEAINQAVPKEKLKIEMLQQEKEILRKLLQDNLDQKTVGLKRQLDSDAEEKLDFPKQITELKKAISKLEQEKQRDLNSHHNLMLEFENKLQKNHENELKTIYENHTNNLLSEKKRASAEMIKIQLDYSQKLAELQNKLKTAIEEKCDAEAKLNIKCDEFNKLKAKMNRMQSMISEN